MVLLCELTGMASRLEISSELAGIISGAEVCGVSISGNVPRWGLQSAGRWVRSPAHPLAYGSSERDISSAISSPQQHHLRNQDIIRARSLLGKGNHHYECVCVCVLYIFMYKYISFCP